MGASLIKDQKDINQEKESTETGETEGVSHEEDSQVEQQARSCKDQREEENMCDNTYKDVDNDEKQEQCNNIIVNDKCSEGEGFDYKTVEKTVNGETGPENSDDKTQPENNEGYNQISKEDACDKKVEDTDMISNKESNSLKQTDNGFVIDNDVTQEATNVVINNKLEAGEMNTELEESIGTQLWENPSKTKVENVHAVMANNELVNEKINQDKKNLETISEPKLKETCHKSSMTLHTEFTEVNSDST